MTDLYGAAGAAGYFLLGNIVLLVFHTDAYGKGKIDVGDYIKWQWLWPLPVAYVMHTLVSEGAKKMARKARNQK